MDDTETDATVKEETTTTELVTPTEEEPEGEDDTPLEVNKDQLSAAELQERDESTATENTEDTEIYTETPDSPELD